MLQTSKAPRIAHQEGVYSTPEAMIFKRLIDDIDGYLERDPAARSRFEVFLTHSGLHAVIWHRAASAMWRRRMYLLARLFALPDVGSPVSKIHPEAKIGDCLVIDHGMGVVIGQTAEIGDNVTLYHGVTLGGIAPSVDSQAQKNVKRHPTIGSGAIVGSGAQVLGPIMVGQNARVGANAVVVMDVPEGCTVVGIPARPVPSSSCKAESFAAYGTPTEELPDPNSRSMEGFLEQLSLLRARVEELERASSMADGPGAAAIGSGESDEKQVKRARSRRVKLSTRGPLCGDGDDRYCDVWRTRASTVGRYRRAPGISQSYLEQLFIKLRRAELVTSVRGPGGGYKLGHDRRCHGHRRHHCRGR